jgi:hypothetical protein
MSWTSTQITQNGNTTLTWSVGPHSSVSTHDAIVVRPSSGTSRLEIESINVKINPTNYHIRVRVIGSGAMAFRFSAEQMD